MSDIHDRIIRKLTEHSPLDAADENALRQLPVRACTVAAGDDLVREDDPADSLAVIVDGLAARSHNQSDGKRQLLSFHMAGEMPDAQMLFLDKRDYAISAM